MKDKTKHLQSQGTSVASTLVQHMRTKGLDDKTIASNFKIPVTTVQATP